MQGHGAHRKCPKEKEWRKNGIVESVVNGQVALEMMEPNLMLIFKVYAKLGVLLKYSRTLIWIMREG